jgi:hypothetical protein
MTDRRQLRVSPRRTWPSGPRLLWGVLGPDTDEVRAATAGHAGTNTRTKTGGSPVVSNFFTANCHARPNLLTLLTRCPPN